MKEIWKDLIYQGSNYGDRFEVSTTGKIRNKITGTVFKLTVGKTGYLCVVVSLGCRSRKKIIKVHKAVAETHLYNTDIELVINHKDGNKLNNNVENLEWCTRQYNSQHAVDNKLLKHHKGFESHKSKATLEQIRFMRSNYIPRHKTFGARAMARKFNLSHDSVLCIIHKKTYKEID